jgi:hypothetical protein
MPWRHNFIRKAACILCSWWKINQMMITHVIYSSSTYLWAPFGVLRHVASRLIAAFGAWMYAEATCLAHPFGVVTVCSDSSYRSICRSKTYSADSLCTSTVSTDIFSDSSSAPFGVSPPWKVIGTLIHRDILCQLWCQKRRGLVAPTIFV